jgi:hypothetical protein
MDMTLKTQVSINVLELKELANDIRSGKLQPAPWTYTMGSIREANATIKALQYNMDYQIQHMHDKDKLATEIDVIAIAIQIALLSRYTMRLSIAELHKYLHTLHSTKERRA